MRDRNNVFISGQIDSNIRFTTDPITGLDQADFWLRQEATEDNRHSTRILCRVVGRRVLDLKEIKDSNDPKKIYLSGKIKNATGSVKYSYVLADQVDF